MRWLTFGLIRFKDSLGKILSSSHAMSRDSKIVRASYEPEVSGVRLGLTLTDEFFLKPVQELQRQLVVGREGFFSYDGLHRGGVLANGVFGILA